jgi:hypothetical protein
MARKSTSRSPNQATGFVKRDKVLNLCRDSKRRTAVTFLTAAQNKFINRLRLGEAEANFRTTDRHYADKWLRKRVFFCSSEQGNPAASSNVAAQSRLLSQNPARSINGGNFAAAACYARLLAGVRKSTDPGNAQAAACGTIRWKKEKSPAFGLFDEFLFRSVHFASLAI